MALGTPVSAAAAYSANGGTSVSPAYPTGILTTDVVVLFVGQKPSTANSGSVTTPSGWTLRESLTAAGGYGATLGIDTGNTNLFVYTWDTPVAGQSGNLAVTLATNNISWAFMVRIPTGGNTDVYGSAEGQRTTTPTSPLSVALTNGASATNFKTGDLAIWAMCVPTDVGGGATFSVETISATGATFGTVSELNEPSSGTGNDIGGMSAWASVTAGSSTTAPTVGATLSGTLTNIRGPIVLLRVRELPLINAEPTSFSYTGVSATLTPARSVTASAGSFDYTGADATLIKAAVPKEINAAAGSFAYTGASSTLSTARALALGPGSFAYSGAATALTTVRSLTLSAGSFTYAGQATSLASARQLLLGSGSFSYTGADATLSYIAARAINAEPAAFTYTGSATALTTTRQATLSAGSFAYTGADTALSRALALSLGAGSFSYTGSNATFEYAAAKEINAQPAAFAYTGAAATLSATKQFTADAGAFAQSPYVDPGYVDPGYVGNAGASLAATRSLTLAAGSFAYTGRSATLLYSRKMTALAGAFTYTGASATLGYSRKMGALAGAFFYTGDPATLVKFSPYPPEADVLAGVVYGPDGIYTGTYTPPASRQILYIFDD